MVAKGGEGPLRIPGIGLRGWREMPSQPVDGLLERLLEGWRDSGQGVPRAEGVAGALDHGNGWRRLGERGFQRRSTAGGKEGIAGSVDQQARHRDSSAGRLDVEGRSVALGIVEDVSIESKRLTGSQWRVDEAALLEGPPRLLSEERHSMHRSPETERAVVASRRGVKQSHSTASAMTEECPAIVV